MKKISIWKLYMMFAIVMTLFMSCLYTTAALFSSSPTNSIVDPTLALTYNFDINSNQQFTIEQGSIIVFDAVTKNNSNGSIYYELYYKMLAPTTNSTELTVAEIGTTLTTSGNLEANNSKSIPIMITNNSSSDVTIMIGIATGFVGNSISYSNSEIKITNLADPTTVPTTSCTSDMIGDCDTGIKTGTIFSNGQWHSATQSVTVCTSSNTVNNGTPVTTTLDASGANAPILSDGMIPIMRFGNTWVKADPTNQYTIYRWFDYTDKQWANAVMTTSATREFYMNASTGTVIDEKDLLAYYVWIPRYRYRLFNINMDLPSTLGFSELSPPLIDIIFETPTTAKSSGRSNDTWYTHPAFTWGTGDDIKELAGIWVGKFEMTGTTNAPTILPNETPIPGYHSVMDIYSIITSMNDSNYLPTESLSTTDIHMMKNTEWGAVAYLKQSTYGLGTTRIGRNSSRLDLTGCGDTATANSTDTCNDYTTTLGTGASTTGNIYGVYDMAGGDGEFVMGVMKTGNGSAIYYGNSGFSTTTLPFELCTANTYLNCYAYDNVSSNPDYTALGDAGGETRKWYSDTAQFVYEGGGVTNYAVWFVRGGDTATTSAGIFASTANSGEYGAGRAVVISLD